jgi:hypothetical protein
MEKNIQLLCTLVILATFILPTSAMISPQKHASFDAPLSMDFDPLVNSIIVTVTIKEIRALKTIDVLSNPDFYVKVVINGEEFSSDVWQDLKYVENPNWSASTEVPKDDEFVNVTIELWDKNTPTDLLCDISPDGDGTFAQQRTAELTYSIATGVWWGDDFGAGGDWFEDPSGYGRLSGIDDNSIYQEDRDCELWFDITQNDYDEDNLPYWIETNIYDTNPMVDNRGEDTDLDGAPIEWEHRFGLTYIEWGHDEGYYAVYDPLVWENHSAIDEDEDGLDNVEEFKTSQWGSDPFRRDMFLEIDQMGKGPNGEGSGPLPLLTYDYLRDSYARYNIVWHIDDGRLGGGEIIPFKGNIEENDLDNYYMNYFMHGDKHNWRRGVFHWGIIGYNESWAKGFCFASRIDGDFAIDCFYLSTKYHDSRVKLIPLIVSIIRRTFNSTIQRALVYAGSIMHETGHQLDIRAPGVDNYNTCWPWQVGFWQYGRYKSVMNYRYVFTNMLDYSDGTHGKNDYDDWGTIDLTNFQPRPHWG